MREHDLSRIDCDIIGINWSILGRQPLIHVISNRILIKKHRESIKDLSPTATMRFHGGRYEMEGSFRPQVIVKYANIRDHGEHKTLPPLPQNYDIHRDGWIFAGGAPCALQVAISQHYNEIIFIGLDLAHGDDMHFYSHEEGAETSQFSGYSRHMLHDAWIIQRRYFELTKHQFIDEMHLTITNTGKSDVFDQAQFNEVFL